MAKIRINLSLKSNEETISKDCLGLYQGNKITYLDDKINVTLLLDDNRIKMNRNTEDYIIEMIFSLGATTQGVYIVKSHKIKMDLTVKTNILEINDNKICIEYELKLNGTEMGRFNYEIIYEVIQ